MAEFVRMEGLDENGLPKPFSTFLIMCSYDAEFRKIRDVYLDTLQSLADKEEYFVEFGLYLPEDTMVERGGIWSVLIRINPVKLYAEKKTPRDALNKLKETLSAFGTVTFTIKSPGGAFGDGETDFVGPDRDEEEVSEKIHAFSYRKMSILAELEYGDREQLTKLVQLWWSKEQLDEAQQIVDFLKEAFPEEGAE